MIDADRKLSTGCDFHSSFVARNDALIRKEKIVCFYAKRILTTLPRLKFMLAFVCWTSI